MKTSIKKTSLKKTRNICTALFLLLATNQNSLVGTANYLAAEEAPSNLTTQNTPQQGPSETQQAQAMPSQGSNQDVNQAPPKETMKGQWLSSLDLAKEQAKAQNKPIYLIFTGTNWCPWCIKLERQVYDKPAFWDSFHDKFIFVKYDINRKRTDEQTHLMDKYGIMGVPSILILNADGQEIGRLGYPSSSMGGGKNPLEVHSGQLTDILNRSKS